MENNLGVDELIIDEDKVPLIGSNWERFQRDYGVQLDYGLKATDGVRFRQWLSILGNAKNRWYAKNYIRALCNAEERVFVHYPVELHHILTNPKVHTRLEKQSQTAITFDPERIGEACITAVETVGIALASSAVEDIITKYSESDDLHLQQSPTALEASSRLNSELRRMHSKDKEILYDDDYTKLPDAVKRSILNWYIEEPTENDDHMVDQQGGDPSGKLLDTVNDLTGQLEASHLKERDGVGYLAKPSDFVLSPPTAGNDAMKSFVSLPQDDLLLRETGLSSGYSDKDIDTVLAASAGPMRTSEFLKALLANKAAKTKAESKTSEKKHSDPDDRSGLQSSNPKGNLLNTKSPMSASQQPSGERSASIPSFVDYFARFSQDSLQEESGDVSLDDLMRNSEARRKLLKDALTSQASANNPEEKEDKGPAVNSTPIVSENDQNDGAGGAKSKHRITPVQQDNSGASGPQQNREATFKQPATPKRKNGNQNRTQSHSPHNKRNGSGSRTQQGAGRTSPSKQWKNRQSPRQHEGGAGNHSGYTQQSAPSPLQQQFDDLRQEVEQRKSRGAFHQQMHPAFRPAVQQTAPQHSQSQAVQAQRVTPQQRGNNLRYIIIDGSNVAMAHGNQQVYSCLGIQLCVQYFLRRGHTQITAFVPQWRCRTNVPPGYEIRDQYILEELREQGYLVYTPARRVPGKNIVCYDDKFVVRLAEETDGIIVSNDNYRDLWQENVAWRKIIEERLLMFSFVGDILMIPDDPLGRDGPHLEEFLQKPYLLTERPVVSLFGSTNQSTTRNGFPPGPAALSARSHPAGRASPGGAAANQHTAERGRAQARKGGDTGDTAWHQNARAAPGARNNQQQRTNSKPLRDPQTTTRLAGELETIFPEESAKIQRILANHPHEEDLNTLCEKLLQS